MNKLRGINQRAVVTGADGGMGRVISRHLASAGYNVLMLCHSFEKGDKCRRQLMEETGNKDIELRTVELASLSDVCRVARTLVEEGKPIALLMNNAARICPMYERTEEGFEKTFVINYLAPYVLTRRLMPLFRSGTRIVNMSSLAIHFGRITYPDIFYYGGKRGRYHRLAAYSNSKLALWWMTLALSGMLKGKGITVNAADPGVVSTNMLVMHNVVIDTLCNLLFRPFTRSAERGARTAVSLLLSPAFSDKAGCLFAGEKSIRLPSRLTSPDNYRKLWDETEHLCQLNHFL